MWRSLRRKRCSIEMDGWIELVFGMDSSFDLSYTVFFWKNSRISKNKSTSFWNFVANSALKFAAARRSSQRVVNLARQRWTLSVIYWINRTVVSQTWVDSTWRRSTASFSHWASMSVYSTIRVRQRVVGRTCSSATADIWYQLNQFRSSFTKLAERNPDECGKTHKKCDLAASDRIIQNINADCRRLEHFWKWI